MTESNNLTLEEAKEIVMEEEDSITDLINPSDLIHQDVNSWEEVDLELLKDELAGNMGDAWTYGINHPYGDMIEEIAVSWYVDDMTRIPFNHLNPEIFKGPEDAIIEGYWLYEMSRNEVENLVYEWNDEIEFFHEVESEIRMEIESAILDARIEDLE